MFHNDPVINAQLDRIDTQSMLTRFKMRINPFYGLYSRVMLWHNPREIGMISKCYISHS